MKSFSDHVDKTPQKTINTALILSIINTIAICVLYLKEYL